MGGECGAREGSPTEGGPGPGSRWGGVGEARLWLRAAGGRSGVAREHPAVWPGRGGLRSRRGRRGVGGGWARACGRGRTCLPPLGPHLQPLQGSGPSSPCGHFWVTPGGQLRTHCPSGSRPNRPGQGGGKGGDRRAALPGHHSWHGGGGGAGEGALAEQGPGCRMRMPRGRRGAAALGLGRGREGWLSEEPAPEKVEPPARALAGGDRPKG